MKVEIHFVENGETVVKIPVPAMATTEYKLTGLPNIHCDGVHTLMGFRYEPILQQCKHKSSPWLRGPCPSKDDEP